MTFESLLFFRAVTGADPVTIQTADASTRATSPAPGPPPGPPPTRRSLPPPPPPPGPVIAASPLKETAAQVPNAAKPGPITPGAARGKGGKGENVVRFVQAMFEVTIRFCNVSRSSQSS